MPRETSSPSQGLVNLAPNTVPGLIGYHVSHGIIYGVLYYVSGRVSVYYGLHALAIPVPAKNNIQKANIESIVTHVVSSCFLISPTS